MISIPAIPIKVPYFYIIIF